MITVFNTVIIQAKFNRLIMEKSDISSNKIGVIW